MMFSTMYRGAIPNNGKEALIPSNKVQVKPQLEFVAARWEWNYMGTTEEDYRIVAYRTTGLQMQGEHILEIKMSKPNCLDLWNKDWVGKILFCMSVSGYFRHQRGRALI